MYQNCNVLHFHCIHLPHFRAVKNVKGIHSKKEFVTHRVAELSGVSIPAVRQEYEVKNWEIVVILLM